MAFKFLLFSSLLLSALSSAYAGENSLIPLDKLPDTITQIQMMAVKQGECESRWREMAADERILKSNVAEGLNLYFVPCAN